MRHLKLTYAGDGHPFEEDLDNISLMWFYPSRDRGLPGTVLGYTDGETEVGDNPYGRTVKESASVIAGKVRAQGYSLLEVDGFYFTKWGAKAAYTFLTDKKNADFSGPPGFAPDAAGLGALQNHIKTPDPVPDFMKYFASVSLGGKREMVEQFQQAAIKAAIPFGDRYDSYVHRINDGASVSVVVAVPSEQKGNECVEAIRRALPHLAPVIASSVQKARDPR